jgi:hypothetical protein
MANEHPDYPLIDWQVAVASGETILGYWSFVNDKLEKDSLHYDDNDAFSYAWPEGTKIEKVTEYQIISAAMDSAVNEAIRAKDPDAKCYVIYSAYESDADGNPINNLEDITIAGHIKLVKLGSIYNPDVSVTLTNPTWLDIAVIANDMIIAKEDFHHVYLESITIINNADPKIPHAMINMGS